MLPLSLSYDHRVIDGADGARFLRWVAEAFAQPFVMVLCRVPKVQGSRVQGFRVPAVLRVQELEP